MPVVTPRALSGPSATGRYGAPGGIPDPGGRRERDDVDRPAVRHPGLGSQVLCLRARHPRGRQQPPYARQRLDRPGVPALGGRLPLPHQLDLPRGRVRGHGGVEVRGVHLKPGRHHPLDQQELQRGRPRPRQLAPRSASALRPSTSFSAGFDRPTRSTHAACTWAARSPSRSHTPGWSSSRRAAPAAPPRPPRGAGQQRADVVKSRGPGRPRSLRVTRRRLLASSLPSTVSVAARISSQPESSRSIAPSSASSRARSALDASAAAARSPGPRRPGPPPAAPGGRSRSSP